MNLFREQTNTLGANAYQIFKALAEKCPWPLGVALGEAIVFENAGFSSLSGDERLERAVAVAVRRVGETGSTYEQEVIGSLEKWLLNAVPFRSESNELLILVAAVPESKFGSEAAQKLRDANRRLRFALDSGFDATYILRHQVFADKGNLFEVVEINKTGRDFLGIPGSDPIEQDFIELVGGAWGHDLREKYVEAVASGEGFTEEFVVCREGTPIWLRQRVTPTFDGLAVVVRNISQKKSLQQQTKEHLRVLENALDGILTTDQEGKIDFINGTFAAMLGQPPESMIGSPWELVAQPEERARLLTLVADSAGDSRFESDVRGHRPDGIPLFLHLVILPRFKEGAKCGYYCFAIDVTPQRAYEAQLEHQMKLINEAREQLEARSHELEVANVRLRDLATTDGLTGLRNHRYFRERLMAETTRAQRYCLPLSILMVDVDYFKQFNDTFGHPAGDEVLRELSAILQSKVRSTDLVARYGGEEFAVVMPQTDTVAANMLAERLRKAVELTQWSLAPITISVGGASFGGRFDTAESLLQAADDALYEAKRRGRNLVHFALSEESA